jgi:hypothetical protein
VELDVEPLLEHRQGSLRRERLLIGAPCRQFLLEYLVVEFRGGRNAGLQGRSGSGQPLPHDARWRTYRGQHGCSVIASVGKQTTRMASWRGTGAICARIGRRTARRREASSRYQTWCLLASAPASMGTRWSQRRHRRWGARLIAARSDRRIVHPGPLTTHTDD